MPAHNWFEAGEWNACCDQCGRVFKSGKLAKRWDNAMCCTACWEPRHPQDFVRAIMDDPSVPWSRPWVLVFSPDPVPANEDDGYINGMAINLFTLG